MKLHTLFDLFFSSKANYCLPLVLLSLAHCEVKWNYPFSSKDSWGHTNDSLPVIGSDIQQCVKVSTMFVLLNQLVHRLHTLLWWKTLSD